MKVNAVRLMYLMHVDARWIKQRPHFLAEELSQKVTTKVFYARSNRRKLLNNDSNLSCKTTPLLQAPYQYNPFFVYINEVLKFVQALFWVLVFKPTHVLISHPCLYTFVYKMLNVKIIYDCMDDVLGFKIDEMKKAKLLKQEHALFNSASVVLSTSSHLRDVLLERCGEKHIVVVRNAFGGNIISDSELSLNIKNNNIGYFGTIADWFDFSLVLPVLEKKNIILHIAGPCEIGIPDHPCIHYHGILKHNKLVDFSSQMSALIMPFKIVPLILSVDPVKLYEYINLHKPIVCVNYPEVVRFEKFCYFYNSATDFESAIEKALSSIKYSADERQKFLLDNTWSERGNKIIDVLCL